MPNWPSESTMTFMPSPFPTVTPRMLPIKHLSLVAKAVPSPGEPMEITLSAVVMLAPASRPMAMLLLPVANLSAPRPKAWLSLPRYVVPECGGTDRGVATACRIGLQSNETDGSVVEAASVCIER